MKYLDQSAEQLAWQFIKNPETVVETFEELFFALEWFALGTREIEVGFEGDEDFWGCGDIEWLLEDIEKALQTAKHRSEPVNRFCDEVEKGRGPSLKEGIRLIRLADDGEKPTQSIEEKWGDWESALRDFVDIFKGTLVMDWLIETASQAEIDGAKPTWLLNERTLSFNGKIVRQFSPQTSGAVLDIFSTFEECGWSIRIDDPLSPPDAEKTKLALRTINSRLVGLRFKKDGDGIRWEVIPN